MQSNRVKSRIVLTLASGLLLGAWQSASADTIVLIDQARSVNTFLIVPQCLGEDFDEEAARGFEPFDSAVATLLDCDSGLGFGAASQQSQIGGNSLTASGTGRSQALGPVPNTIHAFGYTVFSVTFELQSTSEFTLEGVLSAEATGEPFVFFTGAFISLRDSEQELIFKHSVEPGPSGEPNSQILDEVGILDQGVYTLDAQAGDFIDNDVPPSLAGEASFDFTFALKATCAADLNGDAVVGASDLAELLGSWGECAGCPADFDGDGVVGPTDLAMLLGAWGVCT